MNNSWENPDFVSAIAKTGRKHLVMAGLATDVGLCLPAISAVQAGHQVYAIVDVSGTLNPRIEQAAWMRMMQAGVSLTSWTAFTGEIQHNYTQPPGAELLLTIHIDSLQDDCVTEPSRLSYTRSFLIAHLSHCSPFSSTFLGGNCHGTPQPFNS